MPQMAPATPIETRCIVRKRFGVKSMSEAIAVLVQLKEQRFTGSVSICIGQGTPTQYSTEEKSD